MTAKNVLALLLSHPDEQPKEPVAIGVRARWERIPVALRAYGFDVSGGIARWRVRREGELAEVVVVLREGVPRVLAARRLPNWRITQVLMVVCAVALVLGVGESLRPGMETDVVRRTITHVLLFNGLGGLAAVFWSYVILSTHSAAIHVVQRIVTEAWGAKEGDGVDAAERR